MENNYIAKKSKRDYRWKSPPKNTLKQFLDENLELGLKHLYWEDKQKEIFVMKSLHRLHKNYCSDEGEIFYQYSLWKKLTTKAPKGAPIYKDRLRKAILKADEIIALADRDITKGDNASRYYQFLTKASTTYVKKKN